MTIITAIELLETDQNYMEFRKQVLSNPCSTGDGYIVPETNFRMEREIIQGRRFITRNGREFVIGMAKDVQEILKVPLDEFDNLSLKIDKLRTANLVQQLTINRLNATLHTYEKSLYHRITNGVKDYLKLL